MWTWDKTTNYSKAKSNAKLIIYYDRLTLMILHPYCHSLKREDKRSIKFIEVMILI